MCGRVEWDQYKVKSSWPHVRLRKVEHTSNYVE